MAVTLTYDGTLSRVRIDADGLAAADTATVERSIDQIRWVPVRGGLDVPVTAGEMETVDDYEFVVGVPNYYRVRGHSSDPISFVAAGTADSGSSGTRTPGAPAGIIAGDLVLILATTRNSGTGTVDTPTGWEEIVSFGNMALFGRVYDGVWTMPSITFTDGAANEDTIAQAAAFRNAGLVPATSAATQLNASAQNIAHPALTVPDDNLLVIAAGWKQDDWTSVAELAAPAAWSEIGEPDSTAGNDAGQVWNYLIQTDAADVEAGEFTVTGGGSAISRAFVIAFEHAPYLNEQTNSITPDLDGPWLKSTMRAFLNRPVVLGGTPLAPSRDGRGSEHEVPQRTLPVAAVDAGGSRNLTLRIRTSTEEEARDLGFLLASGDVLFLHGPEGSGVPTAGIYLQVKSSLGTPLRNGGSVWHWSVQAREVGPPGPDVVTATATWDSLIALYGTWDDLAASVATWDDLLDLIGDPEEVIVP